ncbi:unnamed protein product, partial [Aureobasidium pullulans]
MLIHFLEYHFLVSIINIITTTATTTKLINMEYMEVLEKICLELEAARKENDLVVKNEELRLIRGR